MQGLRSHLSQAKRCHARWLADLDAMRIPPQSLFKSRSNDDNQIAEMGEHPATERDPNPEPGLEC